MKRVGFILFGVVLATVLTVALGLEVSSAGVAVRLNEAAAATVPIGCPGGPAGPAGPTANYPCPDGGSVVNGVYVSGLSKGDPLAGSGGPVCVAVPIFGGPQGACKVKGQVEIPNDPGSGGAIVFYLKLVVKLINGLVGGVIMLILVVAGIQYITSAGEPARVKAAKNRIMQALTALVLYMFIFAIINFLVPGGIA
jgi:hypothetical protein